jgi:DNA gyrase subunit A
LFVASAHDTILVFTDKGKVYGKKVYELPKLSRQSKGRAIRNILRISPEERIASVLSIRDFDSRFVLLATENGVIKKTELGSYANPRVSGVIAIKIDIDDCLVGAALTGGDDTVFLATRAGMALKFSESDARPMGRATRGVVGIRLRQGDKVVSLCLVKPGQSALTICEKGYGKQTIFDEYRHQRRGGKGVINIKTRGRNGEVVAVLNVNDEDSILLVTGKGMVVRTPVANISKFGRATQGVRIITLKDNDRVQSAARLASEKEVDGSANSAPGARGSSGEQEKGGAVETSEEAKEETR